VVGARPAALAAAAVAGSYLGVRTGATDHLDAAAARAADGTAHPHLDRCLGAATDLGSVYGLAGVSGALAVAGHRRAGAEVLLSGLLAWVGAQAIKPALQRPRPYEGEGAAARLVAVPAGSSWPSGHAAVTAAMAATLWPALGQRGRAAALVATAGVGASRLHVGVHHATDVVAGVGVGVLAAACGRAVVRGVTGRWPTGRHEPGSSGRSS
jgi:membrane-associated phospholipid phosphatase